ncbi:MAG: hypothetical protein OXI95_18820 [bacterium]|nr:hypothetical protein [bacterium]
MTARRDGAFVRPGGFGFEWQIELTATAQETVATDNTLAWGRLDDVGIVRTNPVTEARNSLPHVKPVVARPGRPAPITMGRCTRPSMTPGDTT